VWILLNSLLCGVLATASIFVTVSRIFSRQAAIVASLLFAVAPYAVAYAQEARPYSWLMLLAVWCWYFNHQFLFKRPHLGEAVGILTATLTFLFSHGSGFLLLAAIYAYVGISLLRERIGRATLLKWLGLQLAILMALIPWLLHAFVIRSFISHASVPDAESIPNTLWTLLFGFIAAPWRWFEAAAVLLMYCILVLGMIRSWRTAVFAFSLIFTPMIGCAILSYALHPLWLHRTLAFLTPYTCIAFALVLVAEPDRLVGPLRSASVRRVVQFVVPAALLIAMVVQQTTFVRAWAPKAATQYIQARMSPDDIVYAPTQRFFWGVSWYLAGPGSVRTFGADNMSARAGEVLITTEDEIGRHLRPGRRYWLIYRDSDSFDQVPGFRRLKLREFGRIRVEHVRLRRFRPDAPEGTAVSPRQHRRSPPQQE